MKILPPLRQWLPALLKSRAGQRLAGALVIITAMALTLTFVEVLDTTSRTSAGVGKAAPNAATYEPAATTCSGLVLDRSHHAVLKQACPPAVIRAGTSIVSNRPLSRSDMPPRQNRLTPADRAIAVPESLRTSVWDVGIAPNRSSDASQTLTTTISSEPARP